MNPEQAATFVYVLVVIALLVLVTVVGAWLWQVGYPRLVRAVRRHFQRTELEDVLAPYQERGRTISHVTVVAAPEDER